MSGPNQVPVPSEHPNNDLLADLAAEVLPDDLAGHVQDHVMTCSMCAALLADAEGVRTMLLQVEPEQMPDEVLARLEQALLTARREDEAARAGAGAETGETRILNRLPLGSDRTDPGRRITRSPGPATGRIQAVGPMTGSMATSGPKTGRLSRMSAPTQGARRQAIEEQKADRPSWIARLTPALRIAAAVLVLAGAGVGVLQLRDNASDSGSADTAAAASSAGAPVVTPVQSTKTEYTKQKLPAQVKTLIGNSQKLLAEGTATDSARAQADQYAAGPATEAAKSPEGGDPEAAAATPPPTALTQGQLLRSPAALQECLAAIGAAQVEPVAVDLARYAGREAAIIVLPADGGGYDVWVVARDCRKGSDLAFDVITNVNP